MSTDPEDVLRVQPPYGPLAWLLRNRDKVAAGTPGKLIPNDLAIITGRGIARQWQLVAGLPVDHGTVADEAAMLALHVDSSETAYPRWVVPGDSCLRTDDPGWRWHCIAGHGQVLSDWERRPLGGALGSYQPLDSSLTAIAAQGISAYGLAWLALSGATAAKNALSITRADVGDASTIGRALMALATPGAAKIPQLNPDGSVTAIDLPSGGDTGTAAGYYFSGGKVSWAAATPAIPASGVVTVSCWVRVADGGSGSAVQTIARCGADAHWILRGDGTTLSFYFIVGTTLYRVQGGSSWVVGGGWHHVLARVNGTAASAELWVDGRRTGNTGSSITSYTPNASPVLSVGDAPNPGEAMTGQVRDLVVWRAYLSPEQIIRLSCSEDPTTIGSPTIFASLKATTTESIAGLTGTETGLGTTLFVTRTSRGPA